MYVADADGSHVVELAQGRSPAWSWDGKQIAFIREAREPNGESSATIHVMNADGSDQRPLVGGFAPAWSPDGRISFHSPIPWPPIEPDGGIAVVNSDGSGEKLLLPHAWAQQFNYGYGAEAVQFPTWSPDGQRIAFWVHGGYMGDNSIGVMNPDGTQPHLLEIEGAYGGAQAWGRIAWSPDGSTIVYVGGQGLLGSVPSRGGHQNVHLHPRLGRFPQEPDWSPDGREIVFSEGGPNLNEQQRIYVLTLQTGALRQLIPDEMNPRIANYDDTEPVWSRARR